MENDDILIYDIETSTLGRPDPEKDVLKLFGCYSYKTDKYYLLTDREAIQKVIDKHKYLVGFNNKYYDNPILERSGYNLKFKIIIDLQESIIQRVNVIQLKDGLLNNLLFDNRMDTITKVLQIVNDETGKKEFDYSILNKPSWTSEERKMLEEYTKRDLEVTKKLYEWCENWSEMFKDFLLPRDINYKVHITANPQTLAYKALCKEMNWEVEYNQFDTEPDDENIKGGYVAYPSGEKFSNVDGDIYVLDFASMYPHNLMQGNLYGRVTDGNPNGRPTWNGNGVWKITGEYYSDELAPVGKVVQKWFKQRAELKKQGNKKNYALKILLNILYGILKNKAYAKTYDSIAAGDCTGLGRQLIRYARKIFRNNGYTIIYSDTDSIFLQDTKKRGREYLLDILKTIIDYIKTTVPFPQCLHKETFVETTTGHKKVSELNIGDSVINTNGVFPIKNIKRQHSDKLIKITLENGTIILCTKEHRLLKDKIPTNVCDLKKGDYLWYKKNL